MTSAGGVVVVVVEVVVEVEPISTQTIFGIIVENTRDTHWKKINKVELENSKKDLYWNHISAGAVIRRTFLKKNETVQATKNNKENNYKLPEGAHH